jgi:hypothetical protein
MLGPDQPVILHLLDIPFGAEALEGVRMELVDAAYPLVKGAPPPHQAKLARAGTRARVHRATPGLCCHACICVCLALVRP